jgi:LPXTG-motif cell wall-anchored protein
LGDGNGWSWQQVAFSLEDSTSLVIPVRELQGFSEARSGSAMKMFICPWGTNFDELLLLSAVLVYDGELSSAAPAPAAAEASDAPAPAAPRTGDNTMVALFGMLFVAAAAGFIAIRKNRRQNGY